MKHVSLSNGLLGNLLSRYKTALKNNKAPNTLFDIPVEIIESCRKDICPYCGKKLKRPLKRAVRLCKRKKCIAPNGGFVIKNSTLAKYGIFPSKNLTK